MFVALGMGMYSIATLVLNDIGPFLKKEALQRIVGYVGDKLLFDSIEGCARTRASRFWASTSNLKSPSTPRFATRHGHRV